MKKWFLSVILAIMFILPIKAEAGILDDLEFIHGIHIGAVDYDFYNCTPSCISVDSTGVWGISETLYYKGYKNIHPGLQVGFNQTMTMHIHNPGEVNDRLFYVLAMVRVPVRKINLYAGAGLGSQFTQVVLPDGQQAECNHGAIPVIKAGAEYMVTKRVGLGIEYMFSKTYHDFEGHDKGGHNEEIKLKQNSHNAMAVLAFHF